jgi:hypothetical protein
MAFYQVNLSSLTFSAVWTREVDNGNSVDVLYMDFSKAFDRVPKRRLIYKLQHLGITGNLLAWINVLFV